MNQACFFKNTNLHKRIKMQTPSGHIKSDFVRIKLPGFLILIVLAIASCNNNSKPKFKNNDDALSYYLGVYTALKLKEAGYTTFDPKLFDQAISEVFSKKGFDKDAYQRADMIIFKYITMGHEKQDAMILEAGKKFLAFNKTRKEIKTTPSGLQYEVIKEGKGPIPDAKDSVVLHFIGYTLEGKEFITSDQYAQPYNILQLIPGCNEALHFMKVGSRYKIYLPTELAYRKNPIPGGIVKTNMAVMFDIEIMDMLSARPKK